MCTSGPDRHGPVNIVKNIFVIFKSIQKSYRKERLQFFPNDPISGETFPNILRKNLIMNIYKNAKSSRSRVMRILLINTNSFNTLFTAYVREVRAFDTNLLLAIFFLRLQRRKPARSLVPRSLITAGPHFSYRSRTHSRSMEKFCSELSASHRNWRNVRIFFR